jgi:hypothetical protein
LAGETSNDAGQWQLNLMGDGFGKRSDFTARALGSVRRFYSPTQRIRARGDHDLIKANKELAGFLRHPNQRQRMAPQPYFKLKRKIRGECDFAFEPALETAIFYRCFEVLAACADPNPSAGKLTGNIWENGFVWSHDKADHLRWIPDFIAGHAAALANFMSAFIQLCRNDDIDLFTQGAGYGADAAV